MIRSKRLVLAVCLVAAFMLLPADAKAEEKKGFLIRAWERIRPKKEEKPAPAPKRTESAQVPRQEPEKDKEVTPVTMMPVEPAPEPQVAQKYTFESHLGEDTAMDGEMDYIDESAGVIEDKSPAKSAEEKRPELSRDQMVKIIERRLKSYPQIVLIIPGLEVRQSQEGKEETYYTDKGGIALKLEQLEKESLLRLFGRVNNEATKINTERIIRQIQQQEQLMRQIQQGIPRQPQQPPRVFTPPPQPPQVFTPPQQLPQQPPRIQTPPPAPPAPSRR